MALILNAPLIIWAIVELGYKLVVKTIFAIILTSVSIDVIAMFIPPYQGDQMLVAIFAGVTEARVWRLSLFAVVPQEERIRQPDCWEDVFPFLKWED